MGEATRYRCVACAKRLFGEDAPTEIPDEPEIVVSRASVPVIERRSADFVTPAQLVPDFRQRQTGEPD